MFQRLPDKLRSLNVTLLLIVLLCWLLPTVILGVFLGARMSASLREKTGAAVVLDARQAWTLLNNNVAQAVTLAKDATYDGELARAQSDYASGETRYQEYFKAVRSYLDRKYSRESLFRFALYFTPGKPEEINYTTQAYTDAALFIQHAQARALTVCETLDTGCRFIAANGQAYLLRNLYDTRLERFGILALGLNLDALLAPALQGDANGLIRYAVALDEIRLREFAASDAPGTLQEVGENLLYTQSVSSADYTLRLQARADKHRAFAEQESLLRVTVLLIGLIVPLCVAVTLYVQRRIIRPIGQLAEASRRIEGGELGLEVSVGGAEELRRLGNAFSHMSVTIKRLIDKSYKEEIALRDARIQALQSRINPHFINNALEDINWQARIDGSETVAGMVETLSVLLNAGLNRSERHLVSLLEELRVADAYFYFVGTRFGDRLTIHKDVDVDGCGRALVPLLVIQALVENAVEHGISPAGGGRIALSVKRAGDAVFIAVENDGAALSDEALDRMRRLMLEDAPDEGHIGIRNVSQRLRLLFGDKAGLDFSRGEGGTTVARIRLPYTDQMPRD